MDNEFAALRPVDSSMFSRAGYDETNWRLLFEFKSTHEIRSYKNVSPEIADEALSAESLGKFFNSQIKGNSLWEFDTLGADPSQPPPEPKTTKATKAKPQPELEGGLTEEDLNMIAPAPKQIHVSEVGNWPSSQEVLDDISTFDAEVFEQQGSGPVDPQPGFFAQEHALAKQTEGEILGKFQIPGSAAEALDLLSEHDDEIRAIIQQCKDTADKALTVKVASPESRLQASEVLNGLVERKDKAVELLDPFRKVLYESYTYANDLKKSAIDPLEASVKAVKGQILSWDQAQERARQEALRKAREAAEAEARRLQEEERQRLTLLEVEDKLDQGDEQGAQTLFDAPMIDVPKPYVPVQYIAPAAPVIEGQSSRSNWKVVEDEINMIDFLRAVKMDKFPLEQAAQLIKPDLVELNRLAKALKTAFNVPGVRAEDQGSISVRRKK